MKKYGLVVCVALCLTLMPCASRATLPARVIALDSMSGAWGAGGSQLFNTTWKAGNVIKTFRSSFSPASLGYIVASVAASWVVENYGNQAVGEIRAYLNQAGFNYVDGQWTATSSTPSTRFEPGTAAANDYAAWVGSGHTLNGQVVAMDSSSVIREGVGECSSYYQNICNPSTCSKAGDTSQSYGTIRFWLIHFCDGAGGACSEGHNHWNTCAYSVSGGQTQNFYPPLPVTPADIKARTEQDLTSASPAAQAAVVQAEKVIDRALVGAPVIDIGTGLAIPTGGVLDKAAPGLPADVATPRKAVEVPAAAAIGQPLIDMGTLADAPPGEITPAAVVPDARPYVDPAYAGTYTKASWDTVNGFGTRLASFTDSMKSTGLFQIPGGMFQGIPSGGSSTFTINGGTNYGTHTVDLASWSSLLLILRACFLLGFAYGSVKIVIVH